MESTEDHASTYRRSVCDHLLEVAATETDVENDDLVEPAEEPPQTLLPPLSKRRAFLIRTLALLCACSLSVGSH